MSTTAMQTAASGLSALNTALEVTANNLANVNTPGFKSSRANFQDLLYIEKAQPGAENANGDKTPTGLYVGLGVKVSGTQVNFTQGSPINTGNQFDVAIQGNGFFRVIVPENTGVGGFAYTRNGQFTPNADGQLVLVGDPGRRLADDIVIPKDATGVDIKSDGRVFGLRPGSNTPELLGTIQLTNFVNPAGLKQIGGNLFGETAASGTPITGDPETNNFGTLLAHNYEASNVDPTRELIDLIRTQRAFEMNSQTIRAADETLRTVAQLGR
jgi:flagellar basal-body rod protein FlgG